MTIAQPWNYKHLHGLYVHFVLKGWINKPEENTTHFFLYYQYFTIPKARWTIAAALIRLFNCLLSSPDGYSSCCHQASVLLLIIVLIHSCIPQKPKAITLCKPHPAACRSLVNGSTRHAVEPQGPCLIFPQSSVTHLVNFPEERKTGRDPQEKHAYGLPTW